MWQNIFPFLVWGSSLNRKTLHADFIAGLTGAVIVLPQGVAFAMIAGLPPEYGLYTAMITPVIAALFGSSYHLISGPTTAISIVVFSALRTYAEPGTEAFIELALILTLLAGVFQLLLGFARMGTLVNFVSHTVVIAFTAGAAVLIMTSQIRHILGIQFEQSDSFIETWQGIGTTIGTTNPYVLVVALSTLAAALLIRRFLPRWPYLLLAMVFGSLVSYVMGGTTLDIQLVGKIPASLPPFRVPALNLDSFRQLAPEAFAIALLGLIEAVSIARSISTRSQQRIDGNQEFIGQGLSNIVGSFFSSYAGSGSFTRSGVNYQAGAKTPMAAIFAAILLALMLLLVAPLTAYLPIPAMGGIILLVGYNLIDFDHIRNILKASRSESAVMLVTFLATLFLDLEFAIYIGVILSLIFYLQKTSQPRITRLIPQKTSAGRKFGQLHPEEKQECPQLLVVRMEGALFFGAVSNVEKQLLELTNHQPQQHLLLVADGISLIDVAGAELLLQEAQKRKAAGGNLYIAAMRATQQAFLKRISHEEEDTAHMFFPSKKAAIAGIYPQLDPSVCAQCTVRIFHECNSSS